MNLRLFRLTIAVPLSFLLSSCSLLNVPVQKTIYLDHYMEECASFITMCERAREREDAPWETRLDGIEGFSYEWGFIYELRVRENRIYNPPADTSSIRTELVELVSKEKMPSDTRFQVALTTLDHDEPVIVATGEGFRFHNTKSFTCTTDALCTEIGSLIGQEGLLTLEFAHPETSGDPIIARRVVGFETPQN